MAVRACVVEGRCILTRSVLLTQEEEQKTEEFRLLLGEKKAPNNLVSELRREADKLRTALDAANESNMALHAAVVQHKPALTTLSLPLKKVEDTLPSVTQAADKQSGRLRYKCKHLYNSSLITYCMFGDLCGRCVDVCEEILINSTTFKTG